LKALHHILVSSAETRRAFNSGFDTDSQHRPTEAGELLANTLMLVKVLPLPLALLSVVMPRDILAETSARLVGAFRMTAEMDGNLNRRGSALTHGHIKIARHVIDRFFQN
jgi:hypothetical protein